MVVATELTVRLADHFGPYIASDPSLLSETTSICTHYGVTPEDLFYKWEAFAFNHNLPKSEPLTIDHARELRKIIAASVNAAAAEGVASTPLKPSAALNRGKIAADFTAMLGIKAIPIKTAAAAATRDTFQTPNRPASSLNNSPFGGPGATTATPATPVTASAYKPTAGIRDADVHMSDIDSPSRLATSSSSKHPQWTILESLNEHIPLTGSGSQLAPPVPLGSKKPSSRVSLAMATDPKAWNYRYMFEKKRERSQVLDDRIDDYAALLRTAYAIDDADEFGDPSLPSQEPIQVVGRICPLLPAPESSAGHALKAKAAAKSRSQDDAFGLPKLAETGVVLESSRMMGSGNRTPLVFNKGCVVRHTPQDPGTAGAATTLSLFPGQIVLCRGVNAGADKFAVSEICFPPPLPLAVHTVDEALEHSYSPAKLNGSALNLVAASGPFTADDDLEYAPWHRLMDQLEAGGLPGSKGARRGVPDTLILTGPFVSSTHPLLPFSTLLPEEMFAKHISSRLSTLISKYPATMVVLIPSVCDIVNRHTAYPQPAFSKDDATTLLGLPKQRVRCLPNPSVFYINELVVGVSTADSLGDIKAEEMVTRIEASPTPLSADSLKRAADAVAGKNKETNTRWSRALLSQRSFYPLYPPASTDALAYDTSHSHLLDFPAVTPDLLILPSAKLAAKPFIRVVNSSCVVQPGTVAGDKIASVLTMQVNPLPKHELQANANTNIHQINSKLYDRARIDLVAL